MTRVAMAMQFLSFDCYPLKTSRKLQELEKSLGTRDCYQ